MADHEIDPVIIEYVEHTRDRFGVRGLEDMIELAQQQLVSTRASLKQLEDLDG